jgi:hypothetical protein
MKRLLTYFLLASFVMQSCSGIWVVASFYIQRDYIASTLCVNRFDAISVCKGQCYLEQELKASEEDELQQVPASKQKEVQLYTQDCLSFKLAPVCRLHSEKIPAMDQKLIPQGVVASVFHPPERA